MQSGLIWRALKNKNTLIVGPKSRRIISESVRVQPSIAIFKISEVVLMCTEDGEFLLGEGSKWRLAVGSYTWGVSVA